MIFDIIMVPRRSLTEAQRAESEAQPETTEEGAAKPPVIRGSENLLTNA